MSDFFNDILKGLDGLTEEQLNELMSRLEVKKSGQSRTEGTSNHITISRNKEGLLEKDGRVLACPSCGSVHVVRHGQKDGIPRIKCKDCGKTASVSDNKKNLTYHSRIDSAQWREILRGMVENQSIQTIAANTGLSTTSVWKNMKKVKMLVNEIFNEQDKFVDIAECDEYSVHMSFKGKRDPEFFIFTLGRMPRHHRNRAEKIEYLQKHGLWERLQGDTEKLEALLTGNNYLQGTNKDSVCILTGIDRSGNLFAKPVCLGSIERYHVVKHFTDKFEQDAIMVTDHSNSYVWFAEESNLHHEQVLASKHTNVPYSLARINSVHSILSAYWSDTKENLPATKYLDIETQFFWWLQKNKDLTTQEKIDELLGYINEQEYTAKLEDWQDRPLQLDTKGLIPLKV